MFLLLNLYSYPKCLLCIGQPRDILTAHTAPEFVKNLTPLHHHFAIHNKKLLIFDIISSTCETRSLITVDYEKYQIRHYIGQKGPGYFSTNIICAVSFICVLSHFCLHSLLAMSVPS